MNHLKDQHVLVLGLGISGLAMARWCARLGARVTVADTRANPPQRAKLQEQLASAVFVHGAFDGALLAQVSPTLIARSPGLSPNELTEVRAWAQTQGARLVSELDLFAQALSDLSQREHLPYRPKVLGITGTNGKTTVTSLTGLLLERSGMNVAVAGNIGPALMDVLSQALDAEAVAQAADLAQAELDAAAAEQDAASKAEPELPSSPVLPVQQDIAQADESQLSDGASSTVTEESTELDEQSDQDAQQALDADPESEEDDGLVMLEPPPVEPPLPPHLPGVWVLELSSFQLDGAETGAWATAATAATVINITEDHLDWHGTFDAYAQAKAAVFGEQALVLLNRDDSRVMAFQPPMVTVKISGRNRQRPSRPWASFGLGEPTRAGDWGMETVNGMTWMVRALALDETRKRGRSADDEEEIYFQRLMPVDALRIRGRHNASNALVALALATSTGAALGPMLHALREYRGEPHRMESIGIIEGVEYFNDSKGTNVGATLAAIQGLGAERRLVMILGGDGKGQDFTPLAAPLSQHVRAVFLIGRDGPRIREAIEAAMNEASVELVDASDLADAVQRASDVAQPGDAVLLSPACSSLDQFDNYGHRGQVFVSAVGDVARELGMDLEGVL